MQGPRYREEFELDTRNDESARVERDLLYRNNHQSSSSESNKAPPNSYLPSISPPDARPLTPEDEAGNDARRILLRKHVPLVALPAFHQEPDECRTHGRNQVHRNRKRGEGDDGNAETSGVTENERRQGIDDERSHSSPSPWVATFFDVRDIPHITSFAYFTLTVYHGARQLIFVAILSTFSNTHDITSAAALLDFFTFFVLLWWSWLAQVTYDIR
jgi:hypothetical protein